MPILGIGRLFSKEKILKREKLNVNGKMCTGSYQGIYWQKGRKKVCAKSKIGIFRERNKHRHFWTGRAEKSGFKINN
jgi:hypothetical protein